MKTKEPKELKCMVCKKTFKSRAGLTGHMRMQHGEVRKKTYPDEIGKRLDYIEKRLASSVVIDQEKLDNENRVKEALELLLPLAEKYRLQLGPLGKANFWGYHRTWVVKKTDNDWE